MADAIADVLSETSARIWAELAAKMREHPPLPQGYRWSNVIVERSQIGSTISFTATVKPERVPVTILRLDDHDPLCPVLGDFAGEFCTSCDFIAAVRADEQAKK